MAVSTLKGCGNINEKEVEAFPCCVLIHSKKSTSIDTDGVFIKDHFKISISREFKEEEIMKVKSDSDWSFKVGL